MMRKFLLRIAYALNGGAPTMAPHANLSTLDTLDGMKG
jgi:hypothetical protein